MKLLILATLLSIVVACSAAKPSISLFVPNVVPLAGNTVVTIKGKNFENTTTFYLDEVESFRAFGNTSIVVSSPSTNAVVLAPSGSLGYHRVIAVNPNGDTGGCPESKTYHQPVPGECQADDHLYYSDSCPQENTYLDDTTCKPCPIGGLCPGGGRLWPSVGYWAPVGERGPIVRCENPAACVGGRFSYCGMGYSGYACSACAIGYYKLDQMCHRCPASPTISLLMVIGPLLLVFALFAIVGDKALDALIAIIIFIQHTMYSFLSSQLRIGLIPDFQGIFLDPITLSGVIQCSSNPGYAIGLFIGFVVLVVILAISMILGGYIHAKRVAKRNTSPIGSYGYERSQNYAAISYVEMNEDHDQAQDQTVQSSQILRHRFRRSLYMIGALLYAPTCMHFAIVLRDSTMRFEVESLLFLITSGLLLVLFPVSCFASVKRALRSTPITQLEGSVVKTFSVLVYLPRCENVTTELAENGEKEEYSSADAPSALSIKMWWHRMYILFCFPLVIAFLTAWKMNLVSSSLNYELPSTLTALSVSSALLLLVLTSYLWSKNNSNSDNIVNHDSIGEYDMPRYSRAKLSYFAYGYAIILLVFSILAATTHRSDNVLFGALIVMATTFVFCLVLLAARTRKSSE